MKSKEKDMKDEQNFKSSHTNQQKNKNISKKSIDKFTEQTNAVTECRLASQEEFSNKKSLNSFNSLKSLNSKKFIIQNPNSIKQFQRNNQNHSNTDSNQHEFIITEQNTQQQNGFQFQNSVSKFKNYSNKAKKNRTNFSLGTKVGSQPQKIIQRPIFIQKNCQIAVYLSQKRMVLLEIATNLEDQRLNKMLKQVLQSIYSFQNQRDFNFCKDDTIYCCDQRRNSLTKFYLEQLQTLEAIESPQYSYKLAKKFYEEMVQQMNQCYHKVDDPIAQEHVNLSLKFESQRQWRQKLVINIQQDVLFKNFIELQEKKDLYDEFMLKQKNQKQDQQKQKPKLQQKIRKFFKLKLKNCLDCWLVKSILQKMGCESCYKQIDIQNNEIIQKFNRIK